MTAASATPAGASAGASTNASVGVLNGVRVVEMGTFITGPAASVLLGDFGADVVKVEKPETGDPFRIEPDGALWSANFQAFNRNKRSIALDTTNPADLAEFDRLVAGADVFVQNFRPGAADKMNAGAARLQALNPRLVYCAISGFGPDGPDATRPCYDTVAQAASGYLDLTVDPETRRVTGPAVADSITGMYAALGILGALHERNATGRGRLVELSMLGAMTHFNIDAFTHFYSDGERMAAYTRPAASQAHVLACADGKRIALHMSTPPKFWENLVRATGRDELLAQFPTRQSRLDDHPAVLKALAAIFSERSRDEWCERLQAQDVPHSPVYDASEALESPQARRAGMKLEAAMPGTRRFVAVRNPVSFDRAPPVALRVPPRLDEHRAEILASPANNSQ